MSKPRKTRRTPSGALVDVATGRFTKSNAPRIRPPSETEGTVNQHIVALHSPKKLAKAILGRAYAGDSTAQELVVNATALGTNPQYDTTKLSEDETRQLLALLRKANVDTPVVAATPSPARAPEPTYPDDDEPAPDMTPPVLPAPDPLPEPQPRADVRPAVQPKPAKRVLLGRYDEALLDRCMPSTGGRKNSLMGSMRNNGEYSTLGEGDNFEMRPDPEPAPPPKKKERTN